MIQETNDYIFLKNYKFIIKVYWGRGRPKKRKPL